jgi:hypothetical protein
MVIESFQGFSEAYVNLKFFGENGFSGITFLGAFCYKGKFIFFRSTRQDGFFSSDMTHFENKYIPAYLGPNKLIPKLQMHFSSRRNILRHQLFFKRVFFWVY